MGAMNSTIADYGLIYGKDHDLSLGQVVDKNVHVTVKILPKFGDRANARKNVLFITGEPSPHELPMNHKYHMLEQMPGPCGKDELIDKLWKQYNRKEVLIMKLFLNKMAEAVEQLAKQGQEQYMTMHSWIQHSGFYNKQFNAYAGCNTCRCSPGFVMRGSNITNCAMHVVVK